jgi:hypothetical protein
VIVSSRRNPGIPADVVADHPLRIPDICRSLSPSVHARIIRDAAEVEVYDLLAGESW